MAESKQEQRTVMAHYGSYLCLLCSFREVAPSFDHNYSKLKCFCEVYDDELKSMFVAFSTSYINGHERTSYTQRESEADFH